MHAKTLLKRKTEEENARSKAVSGGGGLQDMLSNALDQRLTSIRSAMTSDDEDTDVEEIDEDDWDD